jgi:hypothetical protein
MQQAGPTGGLAAGLLDLDEIVRLSALVVSDASFH